MNEKLNEAMDAIRDTYIADAAQPKGHKRIWWFSAVAAALVVVLVWHAVANPFVSAKAVALADYSEGDRRSYYDSAHYYMDTLSGFFADSISQVLSGSNGENGAYSPINLYLGLAAVAELTGGDEQILQALQVSDLQTLRKISTALWNVSYLDNGNQTLLANSLWLDKDLSYNQAVMDSLAQYHYTSVYRGNFGTRRTNRDVANWLNGQTGHLLKDSTDGIDLDADTVFALYSTIYFQAKWSSEFSASKNTNAVFHAAGGDISCTYMNKQRINGFYYWGEDFGAITLHMKDGSQMWLILPDEGKTADDVLSSGQYAEMLFGSWENSKAMLINLSLPKFDIRSSGDLREDLMALGITDVFDRNAADFSAAIPDSAGDVWLSAVNQATRVAIDEKGVTAASYIEFPGAGAAAPPDEIIDFILDRPFLFVVTNNLGLPLFAGVVNEP